MTDELDYIRELQNDPEKYMAAVLHWRQTHTLDEAQARYNEILAEEAREADGYENYLAYHELIHGGKVLPHVIEPLRMSFEAHKNGEIFMWLGFRGSLKTTTELTVDSFLIGHHPEMTGIITGASDDNAVINAKFVAQIVELHPEFKRVFPYIKPKEKAWGADGYWVVDARLSEEEWKKRQSKVIDPSFIGGGYKSARINGKHPSLFLTVDDLHDIDTSASVTEREYIKTVFFSQILPTTIRRNDKLLTRVDVTGVPFAKDDSYAQLEQSGGTVVYKLPIMRQAANNAKGAVYIDGVNPNTGVLYEDIQGWWYLTWAENFGVNSIVNVRSKGKAAFWQMYMLDIETAKTAGIKYYLFDHNQINNEWYTVGGADPTTFEQDKQVGGNTMSHFALCYLSKLPMGGAVVAGGILEKCGIEDAKQKILDAQSIFKNWRTTAVENVGPGKVFKNYLMTDPRVRVIASDLVNLGETDIRNKEDRFYTQMSAWLENMVIRISDAPTPYLLGLRRGLDNFFDLPKHDSAKDACDALYHAAKLIPEVLRTPDNSDLSPQGLMGRGSLYTPWSLGVKPHAE